VVDGIERLVEHSLMRSREQPDGTHRFTMLEVIREYGLERLAETPEYDEVHRRHAEFFLHAFGDAETAWSGPNAALWAARSKVEFENLRSALIWSVEHDADLALRLIQVIANYWETLGYYSEARRWCELALASKQPAAPNFRAYTLFEAGFLSTTLGDYAAGWAYSEEGLALYRSLGDDLGAAWCLYGLGRVAMWSGDLNRAVQLYEETVTAARDIDDRLLRSALGNLGAVLVALGDYAQAEACLVDAIERATRAAHIVGLGFIIPEYALLALRQGDLATARKRITEALLIQQQLQDPRYAAQSLEVAAWIDIVQQQPLRAVRLLGAANMLRETIGVRIAPMTQACYDEFLPNAMSQVSPESWEVAWREGQAMSLESAIREALESGALKTSAAPASRPQLIGRQRERRILRQLLGEAIAGHGSVALITGEAGIGMTTLVTDLCSQASDAGAIVLAGYCYDVAMAPPYEPWMQIARSYQPTGLLPALPRFYTDPDVLRALQSQESLFEQATDFFERIAAQRPLVLVLEDIHWCDRSSIELFRYLGRHLADQPILVVATYRDEEITRDHLLHSLLPLITREAKVNRINIPRLREPAIREWVRTKYGLDEAGTTRLVDYVLRLADGNPLFTEEVLRTLETNGVLREMPHGWVIGNLDAVHLPPLVQQVIEARLQRLEKPVLDALEFAATIGPVVPINLWSAASGATDEMLSRTIDQATDAHLLEELPDRQGVRFVHALTRETLYERCGILRQKTLHQRIGEALLQMGASDPDTIAHHFVRAKDPRAAEWLIKAGDRSLRRWALVTAIERFEAAYALIQNDPGTLSEKGWLLYRLAEARRITDPRQGLTYLDQAAKIARDLDDRALAVMVLWSRGRMLSYLGENGLPDLEAAQIALQQLSVTDIENIRNTIRVDTQALQGTLAQWLALYGQYEQGRMTAERYLDTVRNRDRDNVQAEADAYFGSALAHAALGQPAQARYAFARSRDAYAEQYNLYQVATSARFELTSVVLPYYTDQVEERHRLASLGEEAYEQSAQINMPPRFAWAPVLFLEGAWHEAWEVGQRAARTWRLGALQLLGPLARLRGRPAEAWSAVYDVLPRGLDTEIGSRLFVYAMTMHRLAIDLLLDANDTLAAHQWLQTHDRWLAWSEAVLGRAEGHLLWARYHLISGDVQQARSAAEQAIASARQHPQPLATLCARRFLGSLAIHERQYAVAEEHLSTALSLSATLQARYERALTLIDLANLALHSGLPDMVQARLVEARDILRPMGAALALQQTDELEAAHTVPASSPTTHDAVAGLSAREVDVIRLLARGMSNAEIAQELFISPHTAANHVANILNKLGLESRTAAATWAVRNGLVS
jgi:ATP/maltotriose-dependent transcriptional regulator MalT